MNGDILHALNERGDGFLPGLLGVHFTAVEGTRLVARLEVRPEHLAPNGYLHAATVIALADTTCGYGTFLNRPEGIENFTTIELKANFLGTARDGGIACEASLSHGGRTTQVWDATVSNETTGATIALFRCTQLLLQPRPQA